jgi:membrane protease YdiL (CAAX protease family)
MIVNSILMDWNLNFEFPSFLKGFEHWVREREHAVALKTEMLYKFDSSVELLIALLVIAVLPGIGEELVFRGLIQNELYRGTGNIHLSIWIAAAIFSALHMQFFGFVPRLLLGALFGYLYYWSANLSFAMLAHLIFNGATLAFLYFHQKYSFELDIESPVTVLTSAGLAGALLFYFYKYFENRKPPVHQL